MKKTRLLVLVLGVITNTVLGQSTKDSIIAKQTILQNDFINKIKAMGFTPRLTPPVIIVDNPRSWGNFDDSANTIETCDWSTLPPEQKAVFENFASTQGGRMTGERFFQLAVYQWIYVHELGHWWQTCQQEKAEPYETEKGANRLATAYWRQQDPAFYQFMLRVFQGVLDHRPSPVPPGQQKEKYFNDNYQHLPGGTAYSWYQSIQIVEVSKETPLSFAQAIKQNGRK